MLYKFSIISSSLFAREEGWKWLIPRIPRKTNYIVIELIIELERDLTSTNHLANSNIISLALEPLTDTLYIPFP